MSASTLLKHYLNITISFTPCVGVIMQAPGGIGEIFLDPRKGKELLLLKDHKGFVKKAMAHGVPLVPVYGELVMRSSWLTVGDAVMKTKGAKPHRVL